jgi:FKBP-type peptidyl-prolyl cis-trans isomerase
MVRAMKHTTISDFRRLCGVCVLLAAAPLAGAQTTAPAQPAAPAAPAAAAPVSADAPLPKADDQTSYLFGLTFGEQMHRVGITDQVSIEALTRGLKDGLGGKKSAPGDQQALQTYVRALMDATAAHNKAASAEFLARNGKKKGVKTTASGLEYEIITAGDTKAPAIIAADQVTVQYRGTLLDGTEFDSSYSRGTPATFPVGGVIKGWQEALLLMKPGAKWKLYVPPDLAYGMTPRPGIPPGSLLTFEVEMVSVKTPPAPASTAPSPAPAKSDAKSLTQ